MKKSSRKSGPWGISSTIIYLVFFILLILASLTVVQQSQDIRRFAQEATPTPTPMVAAECGSCKSQTCGSGLTCQTEQLTAGGCEMQNGQYVCWDPTYRYICKKPNGSSSCPLPSATPTATPTPTSYLTPTPLLRCNVPCTYNSQCPTELYCYNGACRHPLCKEAADCQCYISPTPRPVTPTMTPRPITPTVKPTATKTPTPTPTLRINVTTTPSVSTSSATPVPTLPDTQFEIDKTPAKVSLLEVFIQFLGNIFCKLFRAC